MASDSKLPVAIFLVLVAIIAVPFAVDWARNGLRPELVEARIVTATASDPVYRDGPRTVPPGEHVDVALAVRFTRLGRSDGWLAPVEALEIEGSPVDHRESSEWPDDDRFVRVFWFSVECSNLGGTMTPETAAERLEYRTFFAPEMGQALLAERLPDVHNDDHIDQSFGQSTDDAGTYRVYARVEIVEAIDDIQALQTATTLGADKVLDPIFPKVLIQADLGENIDFAAGELFRLPGFEPQGDTPSAKNAVTLEALGSDFTQLVTDRIVVSSWTLAASAVSGRPDLDPVRLETLGRVTLVDDRVVGGDGPLTWGGKVLPGDLLADADRWFVLLGDNGDGVLDPSDGVLYSWGRPATRTTILAGVGSDNATLEHRRLVR
jgi:hypothetical protein